MIDPEAEMVHALEKAAEASNPSKIIRWLAVAEAWEARLPPPTPDAPSGFAEIGASSEETYRIILCISPERTAAIFDKRYYPPAGSVFVSPAKAAEWALACLDKAMASEGER